MQGFTRLGETSSAATRSVQMRKLKNVEARAYQIFLEILGNGRVPKLIEMLTIARKLGINYRQARYCTASLVKKGFLEKWTTTFVDPEKGFGHFKKATYYRIKF